VTGRALAVVAMFVLAPAVVDERVVAYGGSLPLRPWETGATSESAGTDLAIDAEAETLWSGGLDEVWWVAFPEPLTITGLVADTGNTWRTTIVPHLVVRGPDGRPPPPSWRYAYERIFYSWHRYETPPTPAGALLLGPRNARTSTPSGRWTLREVRVLTGEPWVVDAGAYPAALGRTAPALVPALLWVLVVLRRRGG